MSTEMMKFVVATLLLVILVSGSEAQLGGGRDKIGGRGRFTKHNPKWLYTAPGPCPSVEVMPQFNEERYYGLWYEIARYPVVYGYGTRCNTVEYSPVPDFIEVVSSGIKGKSEPINTIGRADTPDPNEPGKLALTLTGFDPVKQALAGFFPGKGFDVQKDANYWIIDTDYDNYALIHSCLERSEVGFHTMSNWILARSPNPDDASVVQPALSRFTDFGIPTEVFHFTDHTNCESTGDE